MEQRVPRHAGLWAEPFTPLRVPKLFNLRTDPFERADITSNTYWDWFLDHDYLVVSGGRRSSTEFLETFKEFPPRQEPASFTIDHAVAKLHEFLGGPAEPPRAGRHDGVDPGGTFRWVPTTTTRRRRPSTDVARRTGSGSIGTR